MRDGMPLTGAVSAADWDGEIEKSPAQKKENQQWFSFCAGEGNRTHTPLGTRS